MIFPALLLAAASSRAAFDACKFNVGVDLKQASTSKCGYLGCTTNLSDLNIPTGENFVAMFIGWNQPASTQLAPAPQNAQEGQFLTWATSLSATPIWYTYIIADGAKVAMGLTDCNTGGGSGTLCAQGTAYIRNYRSTIISQYQAYAQFAASKFGTSKPMIWALEPDFYQYASNSSPLSNSEVTSLLTDIVGAIKGAMPNAVISMDISPWAPDSWFTSLPLSLFTYMNTSGGISQPGSTIANGNALTWAHLHSLTGKPMIADDGYGTAGTLTNPNSGWASTSNVTARMNDGVIGLMEAYPTSSWTSTITSLQGLSGTNSCQSTPSYTLTINAGTGGSVSSSPSGSSVQSGTTVTLTATAQSGYTFSGWSGAASGTSTSTTIVVTGNTTVTANFTHVLPKYTLSVSSSSGGTWTVSPSGSSFDSGTVVTLTASATTGYTFQNWSGSATGTTPTIQVVLNSNKSVTATFQQVNAILGGAGHGTGVTAQLEGNQLRVDLSERGMAEFSLVSIDGKSSWHLGNHDLQGQSVMFGLDGIPAGLHLLKVRGEGWQAVVPMAVLGTR
jgi:uncharacterized repeat protein (TIGR02543 family)